MKYVIRNWFLIAIAVAVVVAFFVPQVGPCLKRWNVLKIVLAVAFLTTGLTLDTRMILAEIKNFKAISAAIVSCFVIFPAVAFVLAKMFWSGSGQASQDLFVGACILGAAPATVASGTILSRLAKGSVPLSIFICVATSVVGVLTIPPSLKLMVGISQDIDLPVIKMFTGLVLIVLLPTIAGQLLRIMLKDAIGPCHKYFSLYSKFTVLTIIFSAVARPTTHDNITTMGWRVGYVFLLVGVVHLIMLAVNFGISKLIRLNRPATATFTIHTSQKTLTVSAFVWEEYFAAAFPLALIPVIAHHITQMVVDTIVAERMRLSADRHDEAAAADTDG